MANTRTYPVHLPYDDMGDGSAEDILQLDHPDTHDMAWPTMLHDLAESFTEEEVARVLTGAVLLLAANAGDLGQSLHTAIVWERG